jgi:hypothetical protein
VSAACLSDIKTSAALAATDDGTQTPVPGDAQIKQPAFDCTSVDELESALAKYPGAIGVASAKYLNPVLDVGSDCGSMLKAHAARAALCVDAVKLGLDKSAGY